MSLIERSRLQFPAFQREVAGKPVAYFDGPAGSQVPQSVIDAVADYLAHRNSNLGAASETSHETGEILDDARRCMATLFNVADDETIVFGPNMTSLTFTISRALAQTWRLGDEIIVSRLDHDANVSPWVLAAQSAGATVHHIDVRVEDGTLDQEHFTSLLNNNTKLVAVGYASNITGTINPIREMAQQAHAYGALFYVDAVHYAPHRLIDVADLNVDFLVCSAYKFFGPHVGILYGRRKLLEELQPAKLRPSPNQLPWRWMTGTQNHEGIAGVAAAVKYLAGLTSKPMSSLRDNLVAAFEEIEAHENELAIKLLNEFAKLPQFQLWGISDPNRLSERVPTFSFTHHAKTPQEIARHLATQGIYAWAGNHYALPFTEAVGLEPHGTLRIGALHYNTVDEIDRLMQELRDI